MPSKPYKKFLSNFRHVINGRNKPKPIRLRMTPEGKVGPGIVVLSSVLDEFTSLVMTKYINERIVKEIARQYSTLSLGIHGKKLLQHVKDSEGKSSAFGTPRTTDASMTSAGWSALEARVKEFRPVRSGNEIGFQMGYRVMELRSKQFTQHGFGESKLDNWFFAVEFGTGVAENVGGAKWMRGPGDAPVTVGKDSKSLKEKDGSWWFGARRGQGAHMLGQKGAGIFWEHGSRRPRSLWRKLFTEEFPAFYMQELNNTFGVK